jgi:hypothetical protein
MERVTDCEDVGQWFFMHISAVAVPVHHAFKQERSAKAKDDEQSGYPAVVKLVCETEDEVDEDAAEHGSCGKGEEVGTDLRVLGLRKEQEESADRGKQ